MKKGLFILMAILPWQAAFAQGQTSRFMREGNKLYQEKKYKDAAADYQKALAKNPAYTPGLFNLGNSLYQQKQFDASRQVLANTAKSAGDQGSRSAANYNIGNTYMQEQKWEDAVSAYKQALRNNPQDADAKYNLSYAEEMMKKQKGGGGKDNKKQKDKNQQNKDQQGKNKQDKDQKDKDKQNQQNKDQQKQDQQNKDQQDKDQQQSQGQPSKLSQQQADQLLNALNQEEKKLQDKLNKQKGVPSRMQKDW